ncbi:MAG: LPS translocon maturation chaperone LptM [Steroidobacteraceae bacterium]
MNAHRLIPVLLAGTALLCVLAGCGLKGPLTMPAKSTNVVIRGPGGEAVTAGEAAGPTPATETGPPAAAPGAGRTGTVPQPVDDLDHPPPPPLPGSNPGAHGG